MTELANALRGGGASSDKTREFNAGPAANEGIVKFKEYWDSLSELQKRYIFKEMPRLNDILGRLFRPKDAKYTNAIFCVQLIADLIDPIVLEYNQRYEILKQRVEAKKTAFEDAAKTNRFTIIPNNNPPRNILHHIFKLPIDQQKKIFIDPHCENALMYALRYMFESLSEFELTDAQKQQIVSKKFEPHGDSELMIAAKHGNINRIQLLLEWGAEIDSTDEAGNTALSYAANCGHSDVVKCLLEKGANVTHRNNNGQNALNIAITNKNSTLTNTILMHIATLEVSIQAKCLAQVPGGPYQTVYEYAALRDHGLDHRLQNQKSTKSENEITTALEKIRFFHEHLVQIFAHYETMQTKSLKNSNYKQAAETTKRLLISLVTAKNKFVYESGDFDEFKN